jgi:CheY-like chemotaxis protein
MIRQRTQSSRDHVGDPKQHGVPKAMILQTETEVDRTFRASGPGENPEVLMLRVLLVEDDEITRDVALLLLEHLGYRADIACNGTEAVAAVAVANYDVVLMDVQMPEMDGLDATRRIRADRSLPFQPAIIAMTGSNAAQYQAICLDAGMDDYLPKPIRKDTLADMLTNWSSRRPDVPDDEMREPTRDPVLQIGSVQDDPILDLDVLDNLIASLEFSDEEGQRIRRELISDFLHDSDKRLMAIEEADRANSAEALASTAHAIKSASATLGLICLSNVSADIETLYLTAPEFFDVRFEATVLIATYRRTIHALRLVLEVESGPDI